MLVPLGGVEGAAARCLALAAETVLEAVFLEIKFCEKLLKYIGKR